MKQKGMATPATSSGGGMMKLQGHDAIGRFLPAKSGERCETPDETLARFWSKLTFEPNSGCWLWLAAVSPEGYGHFGLNKRVLNAHRFSYETFVGPIPAGLQLDHKCRVPCCVNPAHLEPVTGKENTRRGMAVAARKRRAASQTHCLRGHPFDADNTIARDGRRHCRACLKEHYRNYRQRKRKNKIVSDGTFDSGYRAAGTLPLDHARAAE